jgi:hypothetical protein
MRRRPLITDTTRTLLVGLSILDYDRDSLIVGGPDATWGLICRRFEEAQGATYHVES